MVALIFLAKVLNMTLFIVAGRWLPSVRGAVLAGALALTAVLAMADSAPAVATADLRPDAQPTAQLAPPSDIAGTADTDTDAQPLVVPQLGLRGPQAGALAPDAAIEAGADSTAASAYQPLASKIKPLPQEYGLASWYGAQLHRKRTASGERFDMHALTAAHRTLPFGSLVCVRSATTGREVVVRINDRGPFTPDRVIDLSRAAAVVLGMLDVGAKEVTLLGSTRDGECPES